jgi:hypothetical protein
MVKRRRCTRGFYRNRLWNREARREGDKLDEMTLLSPRDAAIFALTVQRLGARCDDFAEALRALRDAVETMIAAGRVFPLAMTDAGPVVGSLVSGVGIAPSPRGILVVRVARAGSVALLGPLASFGASTEATRERSVAA